MADVLHADVFFFISSIATIIITVALSIALYYAIRILRDLKEVTEKIREASGELEKDFESLRASVKDEGLRVRTIVELVLAFVARQFRKPRAKRAPKIERD